MSAAAASGLQPVVCPNSNAFRTSCKKRTCPFCGPRWARDWRKVMFINLDAYDGPVVMVAITAPGADRLPWDEAHCRHPNGGQHSGKRGCRCEQRQAREWSETATMRYGMLRQAASRWVRTHAPVPVTLLERVWEPQKRGVPHLHLVLGVKTREELEAAGAFVTKLKEIAGDYDFGHVDARGKKGARNERVVVRGQILKLVSPENAARYLSAYLTGRSKHKASIRENLSDPAIEAMLGRGTLITSPCKSCEGSGKLPSTNPYIVEPKLEECYACKGSGVKSRKPVRQGLPLVWLTPRLTSIKRGGTGVTMRTLRRARHLWVARAKGICEFPKWTDIYEAIYVGAVARRAFPSRGEGDQGPPLDSDFEEALALADRVMARIDMLPDRGPNAWVRRKQEALLQAFGTDIAIALSGIKPVEQPALAVAA